MKKFRLSLCCAMFAATISIPAAYAVTPASFVGQGFVGKNQWLFYRVEFSDAVDLAATNQTIDLIGRVNKLMERNGIAMAVTMVPLKMRIYSEYLPDDVKLNPYMEGNYDRMTKALRAAKVNMIDLNTPFLSSPKRNTDTPFFFRLDTHWSQTGAAYAAEIIRDDLNANPALKKVLNSIPEVKYSMTWSKQKINGPVHDLIEKLPPGTPAVAEEMSLPFSVAREGVSTGGLLGDATTPAITLMGSSYSAPHHRLPDALRYTLQRDILAVSVEAIQGSWVGLESYLRDDSFQTSKPKLLIWEMPERDMRMPPNYKYRDDRYNSDNTEWLLRVAAWVQSSCTPSPVAAKLALSGLVTSDSDNVTAGRTTDKSFIELNFSKPIEKLDYLSARVATNGSKKMILEASGDGVETRWFDYPVSGDGAEHAFRSPLPSYGKGYTKLRIFPGRSSAFVFKGLQVCRQPEDLLK